jgi:23S rRNA (adenine2503-C2)-methyltransferase
VKIVGQRGESDLATVYIGELSGGELIEFVESVQPPIPQNEKWVLIVSTLKGCPVNCPICDAGISYAGKLSFGEIIGQIDYMVRKRYSDGKIPVSKFKIQFARMGDPAFNPAVLDVLSELPCVYDAPGLLPSISTIAPRGCDDFWGKLTEVKNRLYCNGRFQMQFSIHTSSEKARRELVPCSTLSFDEMSNWGADFFSSGDRKISLNFAAVRGYPVDPAVIADHFSPECFMIKLTPVNPTHSSRSRGLEGIIDPDSPETADELVNGFGNAGFDTILSIGETRENRIGSNCGMYVGRLSSNLEEKAPQKHALQMLSRELPDRYRRERN